MEERQLHKLTLCEPMHNPSLPKQQRCGFTLRRRLGLSAFPVSGSYHVGYQQALMDFAVTDLLHHIKIRPDISFDTVQTTLTAPEAEALAAMLVQTLANNLDGDLLTIQLNAIRHNSPSVLTPLTKLHLPRPNFNLPVQFPDVEVPRFLYGDRLCWVSDNELTDWGIVIGRFYSFAPHRRRWGWCYLIWLDPDSPSSDWVRADIAWEDDLEPLKVE